MLDYVVVDLETTGFSPSVNEIIQVGGLKVVKGEIVSSFATYVKPVRYITRQITELTGITNDDVEFAPDICFVLQDFFDWCGGYPFVGHNISFDYRFLCRYGADEAMVDFSLKKQRQGIDTLELARKLLNLKSNRLIDVATACNVSVSKSHDAIADCHTTKQIYNWFQLYHKHEDIVMFPKYLDKRDEDIGRAVDNGTLELT